MIPRCFFDPVQRRGRHVRLSRDQSHYLVRVLRLSQGGRLILLDNSGQEFPAVIEELGPAGVCCLIQEERPNRAEPPVCITLVQGLPRGEKFDWIIQKTTELGIGAIIPLLSDHSPSLWRGERSAGKLKRWCTIAREAAEQSERGRIPEIVAPVTWSDLWPRLAPDAEILSLHPRAGTLLLKALAVLQPESPVVLLVGPESGWSEAELTGIQYRHIPLVRLGPRVLRTETAAIAAVATVVQHLEGATYEDFVGSGPFPLHNYPE